MGRVRSESGGSSRRSELSAATALPVAITCGLAAGYLDVAIIIMRRFFLNPEGYYRVARDFAWSVPAVHAALLAIPGVVFGAVCRLARGLIPARLGVWVVATLGLWGALLRLPLHWAGSLLLAGGLARVAAGRLTDVRRVRRALVVMVVPLAGLAALTTGREWLAESRAVGRLPAPPAGARARNVVLIVWDTVRAYNIANHGYGRATTPNLSRCAERGVQYLYTIAPAPWTMPSHSSFFTGQWPPRLDSQWKMKLETPDPTLAEYLVSRGYQTAGFAGNTNCCTYESGLNRGFLHYEDYSAAPLALLGRTVPGGWLVERILRQGGWYHAAKWARLQSRDASGINDAFLGWLDRRRTDRPFFAFLNYFDAHEPYVPPPGFAGRFGTRLVAPRDYGFLLDYTAIPKSEASRRDILMARDAYDDCIAYLDEHLGRLVAELDRRGLMADTEVIITSDHGEGFGDHGILGHSYSLFLDEIGVPLVMLSPEAPAGRKVFRVASLRDIPATVVDRLGLAKDSPFPGGSLAAFWGNPPGRDTGSLTSPAFSEQVSRVTPRPEPGPGGVLPGFQMSVIASGYHYIRDGAGKEQLYHLIEDPFERRELLSSPGPKPDRTPFRRALLKVLVENPGTEEAERAYLGDFRRSLESLVRDPPWRGADD